MFLFCAGITMLQRMYRVSIHGNEQEKQSCITVFRESARMREEFYEEFAGVDSCTAEAIKETFPELFS